MTESVPEGYSLKGADEAHAHNRIVNEKTGEWYFLTNRSFKEIDFHFNHFTSKLINYLVNGSKQGEKVQILDLGGGSNSRSSKEIGEKYGEKVNCISVDLASHPDLQSGNQVMGDIMKLPIKSGTIDFAYSRITAELIAENSMSNFDKVLEEAARVLKPGSVAFLDGTLYARPINNKEQSYHTRQLQEILKAKFFAKPLGLNLSIMEKLDELVDHKHKDWVFLVVAKEPVKPEIVRLLKLK